MAVVPRHGMPFRQQLLHLLSSGAIQGLQKNYEDRPTGGLTDINEARLGQPQCVPLV